MAKVELDVDLRKFKYSLVGYGYLKEEVEQMTEDELKDILIHRIQNYIAVEYDKSR